MLVHNVLHTTWLNSVQEWVESVKNGSVRQLIYPTGRKFSLESTFFYFANGKLAKFEFRSFFFRNFLLIAYTIEIQNAKFATILFSDFDLSEQGR